MEAIAPIVGICALALFIFGLGCIIESRDKTIYSVAGRAYRKHGNADGVVIGVVFICLSFFALVLATIALLV